MNSRYIVITLFLFVLFSSFLWLFAKPKPVQNVQKQARYWFILHRKSNDETLYKGVPGNSRESTVIKRFHVKTGIPGERPTPLPQLVGREYWLITGKMKTTDNPETAPYFLTLNIPAPETVPFGPEPYLECNGQCNWQVPGPFGLHGVASDEARLASTDRGSSGCVRHSDTDITYLYNLLDTQQEIRYYVVDS